MEVHSAGDGARQFYTLKSELEQAMRDAEAGEFEEFDALAYEPDAAVGAEYAYRDENREVG